MNEQDYLNVKRLTIIRAIRTLLNEMGVDLSDPDFTDAREASLATRNIEERLEAIVTTEE